MVGMVGLSTLVLDLYQMVDRRGARRYRRPSRLSAGCFAEEGQRMDPWKAGVGVLRGRTKGERFALIASTLRQP